MVSTRRRNRRHARRITATLIVLGLAAIGIVGFVVSCAPHSETSAAPLGPVTSSEANVQTISTEVAGATAPVAFPDVAGFEYALTGTDERGWRTYRIRIKSGGSPNLVSVEKMTPLFEVNGQDGPTYVWNQFSTQNPHRRPNTIQPGDEFTLPVPPDAFMVLSQEDHVEHLGGMARVRVYVSEQGDQLRYYLTDPFPLVYELQRANSTHASLVFHRELTYQLTSGRTDATRLAQLIYRIPDPDIYQMEATKALVTRALAGENVNMDVDRSRRYLDPVRDAMQSATTTEQVTERDRNHLTRALFDDPARSQHAAVEDSLGTASDIVELPNGRVFRIEYLWDGTVRVHYKTGHDDAMGKRKPDLARENERWAAVYQRVLTTGDWPVRWGAGEPADLEQFPTARDPRNKATNPERAYDYLIPGRVMVLTFKPNRHYLESQADNAVFAAIKDAQERFRDQIESAFGLVDQLGGRDLLSTDQQAPRPTGTTE